MTEDGADGAAADSDRKSDVLARFLPALPLALVFVWACFLYAWQAWLVGTPWLFTDELERTQLARAIAESGSPARRGDPHSVTSISLFAIAPAWLLDDVDAAYAVAKWIGVAAMTAAVFPAYALARLVAGPTPALLAATASIAIPAFMYSGLLLEEPFAYTWSTLVLWLAARAALRPTRWTIALAAATALAGVVVRRELAILPLVVAAALAAGAWDSSEAVLARRRLWSRGDWAGVVLLALGPVIAAGATFAKLSHTWDTATRHYKDRMLDLGSAAVGAFAIGVGILPLVVSLALLVPTRGERPDAALRVLRVSLIAAIVGFGLYTAVKAAFLSTTFSTRIAERNFIYLAPLMFAATAAWVERPRLRLGAIAGAGALVAAVVLTTEVELGYPYFEAPGFSILALANRTFEWSFEEIRSGLVVALAVAVAVVAASRALARARAVAAHAVAVSALVVVLAWNVAGQATASSGSREVAEQTLANFPSPPDWVDRAAGGERVLYLGQGVETPTAVIADDPTGIHLLEFWNRSIAAVWSLDGSAPGPGSTITPDVVDGTGALRAGGEFPLVLAESSILIHGEVVTRGGGWTLYRPAPPLRLVETVAGVHPDGWAGARATYARFTARGTAPGHVRVSISRSGAPSGAGRGTVVVRTGPPAFRFGRPVLARATATRRLVIAPGEQRTLLLPPTRPPTVVEVSSETFVPSRLDARSGDVRELGAQVAFTFVRR